MSKRLDVARAVLALDDRDITLDELRQIKKRVDAVIEKREKEREVEVRAGWSTDGRLIFKIAPIAMVAPNTLLPIQLSPLNTVDGLEVRYWHSDDQQHPTTLRIPLSLADTLADALHKAALRK